MTEPEPELLSLLQKIANPLESVTLKLKLHGTFAPPQQWKLTDQANPNIFGYSIKILGQEFTGGKIEPRKLTEKQLKELEEKNKKGGKKQTKQQQKPNQVDQAQQQRKQREWNALSQSQKFHRTQEDPYKAFSLHTPQKHKQIHFTKETIPQLQNQISNDAIQVILTRKPQMSEDDLQKLKKSKPKNLNVGELYAAVYKGTIKAKSLEAPGATHLVQRVKLSFAGNVPDDGIKIETDNCYIYLEIECSQPLTPQVKQIKPTTKQIIPEFKAQQNKKAPIQKLKQQLCKSIRAISQQYIACFSKQKQHTQEKRHTNLSSVSTLRLNQINRRKEIFLNQFISSGKFNILKQRISKSIRAVIIDKFRKQKQGNTFSIEQINQTLSQLNLYFQEEFAKTIDEFMAADSVTVHEDLVLGYEHSRQARKNAIAPISKQTDIQRQMRLANQYEILEKNQNENQIYKAQKNYVNVLILSKYSIEAKQSYAKFCLRSKKFNEAYILYGQISQESQQLQHKMIQAFLLVNRRRIEEATILLGKMMQDPNCQTVNKINYNLLLSFMHERENDIKSSQKYLANAERYYKMKNNPHMKFIAVQNPYQLPKPKVPKPERYVSQLSHSESQQIRLNFIMMLAQLNLFNLVSEYLPKLEDSKKKTILQIQVEIFNKNYDEALTKIQTFLKKDDNIRNIDYLMIKADICYHADKMFECEQIFLQILQLKPAAQKIIQVYLRLGQIYLSRKSWQDAKQIFEKAVEQKYNCSVAWQGLGISNLNLGKYDEAEQALNLSNIYNPLSGDDQRYQKQVDEYQRKKYQMFTMSSKKHDS